MKKESKSNKNMDKADDIKITPELLARIEEAEKNLKEGKVIQLNKENIDKFFDGLKSSND